MTAIEETEIYKELCEVYGVRKLGCRGTVKQNIPCEYGNEIWQKCKKEGLECDEKEKRRKRNFLFKKICK